MSNKCLSAGCGHLDPHCLTFHFVFYCGFDEIEIDTTAIDCRQILEERKIEKSQISDFLINLVSVLKRDKSIIDIDIIDHSSPSQFITTIDQNQLSEDERRAIGEIYAESIGHRFVSHWHLIAQQSVYEEDDDGDWRSDGRLFNEINGKIEKEIEEKSIKQLRFRSLK